MLLATWDMDGCLADTEPDAVLRPYSLLHAPAIETPVSWAANYLRHPSYYNFVVTGRPVETRPFTAAWLVRAGLQSLSKQILCRPSDVPYTERHQWKLLAVLTLLDLFRPANLYMHDDNLELLQKACAADPRIRAAHVTRATNRLIYFGQETTNAATGTSKGTAV